MQLPGCSMCSAKAPIATFNATGLRPLGQRPVLRLRLNRVTRAASDSSSGAGAVGTAATVLGAISNPLVLYSLFVLKTTGSGLPPGPGGIYGAAEGIAYLVVVGVVGWSIFKKVRTGSGLPGTGLGAVEGFSYLSVLAAVVVFGLEFLQKGALPGVTG